MTYATHTPADLACATTNGKICFRQILGVTINAPKYEIKSIMVLVNIVVLLLTD